MKVVVIGGSGHIGTYLIPRLVLAGHEVVNVSRGKRRAYKDSGTWNAVEAVHLDREQEERDGSFGRKLRALNADTVIDLICFTESSVRQTVDALGGSIGHYLLCGTIWIHGPSVSVPTTEEEPRRPFGDYGIQKAAIESYLLRESRRSGFPATLLHPGHIVGEGWMPLNPAGNFNPVVFEHLAAGKEVTLPNLGMETVHHVHADDVAQSFMAALSRPSASIGESFHVVSGAALSLRGFAERVSQRYGKAPMLKFLPWDAFREQVSPEDAQATWDHIAHSPNCSIDKARRMLGYVPRYSSLEAVFESLDWLAANEVLRLN